MKTLILAATLHAAHALNNGVARTPPMGWSTWNTLRCNFNASVLLNVGHAMKAAGMVDAGYASLNIDDCWPLKARAKDGTIVPDPARFPNGMRAFSDQLMQETGLALGIYTAHGTKTCEGFPGSLGHEEQDARSYASWNVVYVKNDWCWHGEENQTKHLNAFTAMRDALNKTGVRMVHSIHWNFDDTPGPNCTRGADCPKEMAKVANLWRIGGDIRSAWDSILTLIDIDTDTSSHPNASHISAFARPGQWNDADMLEVGNSMTPDQDRAHFAMWCILASPLIAGNDPRKMTPATIATLTNKDAIAISQDPLGAQAVLVSVNGSVPTSLMPTYEYAASLSSSSDVNDVESGKVSPQPKGTQAWAKPLANGDVALVLLNRDAKHAANITVNFAAFAAKLGPAFAGKLSWDATDIWNGGKSVGTKTGTITAAVAKSACVFFHLKAVRKTAKKVVTFGIITDVHYADAPASGSRVYRDSLPKVTQAVNDFTKENVDFVMELGDFKDTDASQACDKKPDPHCVNLTIGFLRKIEETMRNGYAGPCYHVLGNHDVDILNQSIVLANEVNGPAPPVVNPGGGAGYYSWSPGATPAPAGNDTGRTIGCVVKMNSDINDANSIWIVHPDGTRNWLQYPPASCFAKAIVVPSIDVFPKRDGGTGQYTLNAADSAAACNNNAKCAEVPAPAKPAPAPPLRFLVLNADFTAKGVAWKDLDNVNKSVIPNMSWDKANVPSWQMTWLAAELETALKLGQRVIVFVHYRVDGNGGNAGKGLGPPLPASNAKWVDECTLQNAAVVRDVLEHHPGLVLATFSGHDHVPVPAWTQEAIGKPAYFTHHGLVEGHFPASNAYSVVEVNDDCSITVRGYGIATSAVLKGPENCSLSV